MEIWYLLKEQQESHGIKLDAFFKEKKLQQNYIQQQYHILTPLQVISLPWVQYLLPAIDNL